MLNNINMKKIEAKINKDRPEEIINNKKCCTCIHLIEVKFYIDHPEHPTYGYQSGCGADADELMSVRLFEENVFTGLKEKKCDCNKYEKCSIYKK